MSLESGWPISQLLQAVWTLNYQRMPLFLVVSFQPQFSTCCDMHCQCCHASARVHMHALRRVCFCQVAYAM